MTALNAQTPASSLDDERRAHEPSMEEILASIRRIIADDDATVSTRRERVDRHGTASAYQDEAQPALAVAPPSAVEAAHVNEIEADDYAAAAEFHDSDDTYEESAAVSVEEHVPGPESEAREEIVASHDYYEQADEETGYYQNARESFEPAESAAPLVSPDAAASITAQFQALAASMVINDSGLLHDYAREMLRPMLKAWLDDNLPVLVERLVRAEIERVARGGRR
ncbi:MAG: DUF2497 domain-containing protein [Methylocystis sp.]|jgi:cell pole-organizing protein PopZ